MDKISTSISNNVKSGQYFIDARKWYLAKFIYPVCERSLLFVVFLATIITFLFLSIFIYQSFPLKKEIDLVSEVSDQAVYYSSIKSIEKLSESSAQSIAKYILSYYVKARESYNYNNLEQQVVNIKNLSSVIEFKKFYSNLSLENPNSPVLKYQRDVIRNVEIDKIFFNNNMNDPIPNKATILFKTTLRDLNNKKDTINNWQVDISFDITDPNLVINNKNSFDFTVNDYNVSQIN